MEPVIPPPILHLNCPADGAVSGRGRGPDPLLSLLPIGRFHPDLHIDRPGVDCPLAPDLSPARFFGPSRQGASQRDPGATTHLDDGDLCRFDRTFLLCRFSPGTLAAHPVDGAQLQQLRQGIVAHPCIIDR